MTRRPGDLSLRVIMFHEAIARRLGISNSEHKLLDLVAQHPDGMSPGDLASRTGLSNPAITKLVSSLEAAGYVSRHRNEADGRSVLVRLADGYDAAMRPSTARLAERIHAMNSTFTLAEIAAVERWLTGVIDALGSRPSSSSAELSDAVGPRGRAGRKVQPWSS